MAAESARTRKVRNAIMVAVIAVIAVVAIALVGNLQGWFGGGGSMTASGKVGTVNVERSGVSYEIEDGDEVRSGDALKTLSDSSISIDFSDGGGVDIDGGSTLSVGIGSDWLSDMSESYAEHGYSSDDGLLAAYLEEGQLVVDSPSAYCVATADGNLVYMQDAVCTVSLQGEALDVGVLSGSVEVDGTAAEAGSLAVVVSGELSVEELDATIYNDFALSALEEIASSEELCFTADELAQVLADREEQTQQAQAEDIDAASGTGELSCTLEIRCDTILDNMDQLSSSKTSYLPDDGVILPATTVSFSEGDTVYDVLATACDAADIQLEASWSPLYDSYYIEGIGNIYEFDCGSASGWTYQVNGWTPSYGASSYELEDGDAVQVLYTCDYGDDL